MEESEAQLLGSEFWVLKAFANIARKRLPTPSKETEGGGKPDPRPRQVDRDTIMSIFGKYKLSLPRLRGMLETSKLSGH